MHVRKKFCNFLNLSLKMIDINVTSVVDKITKWVDSGEETKVFQELIEILTLPDELKFTNWRTFTALNGVGICTICKSFLQTFINFRRRGMSEDNIAKHAIKLCVLLNFQTEGVCTGVVKLNLVCARFVIYHKINTDTCNYINTFFSR